MNGRVLIIAGSDSGGGAGIQGDIKTVTALGGYAATAITALTAQNTLGVFGIYDVPPDFVKQQIRVVLEDIGADAIKTGMLHKAGIVEAVADALMTYPDIPLILDPVMIAKGGTALLESEAVEAMKRRLFPRALLITPNIPEARELLKGRIELPGELAIDDMKRAAGALLQLGSKAVLIKGGHMKGEKMTHILAEKLDDALDFRTVELTSERIDTPHTHGTGCALASAIATGIAQGMELEESCARAHVYVHRAILGAPGLGEGHGPLGHMVRL